MSLWCYRYLGYGYWMYALTSDFKALLLVKKGKLYLLDGTVVMDLDQEPITPGSRL